MTILLTTPADAGFNAPGLAAPRAKIIRFAVDLEAGTAAIVVAFGDMVGDDFVTLKADGLSPEGQEVLLRRYYTISGANLGSLFDEIVTKGHAWLINKGHLVGAVE